MAVAVMWGMMMLVCGAALARPQAGAQLPPEPLGPLSPLDPLSPMDPVHVQPRDINVINEPTCEELKAMWRFSKRQARTPEIMNEISTYKDPFSYNEWSPYYASTSGGYVSSARSAGGSTSSRFKSGSRNRPVFGRVIHKAPLSAAVSYAPHGNRGYEQVAKLYGTLQGESPSRRQNVLRFPGGGIPAQTGRFQRLKEIIRTERARELQQQRAAEELAARAAALKEIAGGQRFQDDYHGHKHRDYLRAPWNTPNDYTMIDDPSYYHTPQRHSSNSVPQQHEGMIAYPDLLAPPARRSSAFFRTHQNPQTPFFFAPFLTEEEPIYLKPFLFEAQNGGNLFNGHMFQRMDAGPDLSLN